MGRVSDITEKKRIEISTLIKLNTYSFSEIGKKTGVSHQTVSRIAQKLQNGISPSTNKRANSGRKRMTTSREDRKIIKTTLLNRKVPLKVLKRKILEDGVEVSSMTLRRRLYEKNIKCYRPTKRPFLNAAMKKKRKIWARLMRGNTQDYWQKVIFSDECRLEIMTESTEFVRRRSWEKYNEGCVVNRVKHPASVMVWGCITAEGPGPLYVVEGTLRQDQYHNILKDVFLPFLDTLDNNRHIYTFMQDGAPCHTAKKIKDFFQNERIMVLPWPGNSPDMNPIENCWSSLKRLVYSRPNTNQSMLTNNIRDIWENSEEFKEEVKSNMKTMPSLYLEYFLIKPRFQISQLL